MGRIEVICGPMFSGKTEELIRRLKRAAIARQELAICVVCGQPAGRSQRIIFSEPRPASTPPHQELLPFPRG